MKILKRLCLVILMAIAFTPCANGAEDPVSDSFREEWDVFVESIPEEIRPLAQDTFNSANAGEAMKETLSLSFFGGKIASALKDAWPSSLGLLFSLTGLLIFSALFHRLRESLSSETMNAAGNLCGTLCLILCITPMIRSASEMSEG